MFKRVIGIALLVVLVLGGVLAINSYTSASVRPMPAPVVSGTKKSLNAISAEGIVVPSQRATLAFKIGGRVTEILVHEGDEVKSGSILARLDDSLLKQQVAQAQATLSVAQKQLVQLRAGGTVADRQAALAALAAARAQNARVKAGPTADELAQLKANLEAAEALLAQAQFRYDRIGGAANPFGGAAPESLALQQAFINLAVAQAAYRDAVTHPTESELKSAEQAVAQAESALAHLDATPEALAVAQAQVDQAQAALDLAKTAAKDTILVAPFDGTVTMIGVDVGQVVAPAMPAITLGELSKLQVETTDLAEGDVARVTQGQSVRVTLDAVPEQVLTGQVTRIAPMATDRQGDQVFKVTVDIPLTPELRWGLTANVDIKPGQ